MLYKKLLFCLGVLLLFTPLSACLSQNRVFAFTSSEVDKIVINEVEITDSETISEISEMVKKTSGYKVDATANESEYQYDVRCYDATGNLVQFFKFDDNGALFKAGRYSSPDILNSNYYYSGDLDSDDLERILEIID